MMSSEYIFLDQSEKCSQLRLVIADYLLTPQARNLPPYLYHGFGAALNMKLPQI